MDELINRGIPMYKAGDRVLYDGKTGIIAGRFGIVWAVKLDNGYTVFVHSDSLMPAQIDLWGHEDD